MRRSIVRKILGTLLSLLILAALCGCGMGAGPDPEPTPAPTPEPTPTVDPAEEAARQVRQERLAAPEDGFLLDKGCRYAVDEEGGLRCST